jgi:hypothetical protein
MASIGLGAALLTGGVIRTVMRSRSRHAVSAAPVAGGAVLSLGGEF